MKIKLLKTCKLLMLNAALLLLVINAYSQATIFTVAKADGFGANATGGAGGDVVTVATLSELKAAVESSTKTIVVVKGTIDLGSNSLMINSNKTLIGENTSSTLKGNLRISGENNVIVQNLNITNPSDIGTGDGIEVSGSTNIFITKCTLIDCKDGSIDIVRASDYVTLSWNRYKYPTRTTHCFPNLIGNSDDKIGDRGKLHCTLHHNWYDDGVIERMPRVRYGQVHVYNNYYSSNKTNYCVGIGTESQVLVEKCYFDNQPDLWYNWSDKPTQVQGLIQWENLHLVNSQYPEWAPNSTVFDPSETYEYSTHAAEDIKSIVMLSAGNTESVYDETTFTLTTAFTGQGSINPTTMQCVSGTTVSVTAIPDEGWQFDNWSGDENGTDNPIDIKMNSDVSITANFSQISSILNGRNDSDLSIYPNPANDFLMIEFKTEQSEDVAISLFNMAGKRIKSVATSGSQYSLDISDVREGLYVIKISGTTIKKVERIVVQ